MQVDDVPSYTVVVAATNHAELLDRAAWRRFQVRLLLNPPTRRELAAYIARFAATLDEPLGRTAETIAKSLGAISYAEAEEFCRDVRRRSTLALGEQPLKAIVTDRLTLWAERSHASACQETSVGGVSATPDPYPRAYPPSLIDARRDQAAEAGCSYLTGHGRATGWDRSSSASAPSSTKNATR